MSESGEKDQAAFQRELRATSDQLLASMARLLELETRKRQLLPGSPEFLELAREVEELTAAMIDLSGREAGLAQDVRDLPLGSAATTPIEKLTSNRADEKVLREWQAAEQRLSEVRPGSPSYSAVRDDARRLREEFRRLRR
jgi:hypothetical protein